MAAPAAGAQDRTDVDLMKAAQRYRALCELGEKFGVVPQVEVWGFSKTLNRLGETMLVAMESGHPKACVLADVYHLHKGGSGFTGLNLASGFAFCHGGVFVLQVPYLLFYPDRDRNDVPDADPEVLLTGFGTVPMRTRRPSAAHHGEWRSRSARGSRDHGS